MNAKDVIRHHLDSVSQVANMYVADLDDSALRVRALPGMNTIAWQLGHLIVSERSMAEGIKPGSSPALPDGFEAAHSRDQAGSDDNKGYLSKAEYTRLAEAQRAATKAVLEGLPEADLDKPAPERFHRMAPTIGTLFLLVGNHQAMHMGQYVAVRRKVGKPVVI